MRAARIALAMAAVTSLSLFPAVDVADADTGATVVD